MQKILMSVLTIALVSIVAVGATKAYFSDTETSTGNSFTAGTLDLKLDAGDVDVTKFTITTANPGQSGYGTWSVNNSGSVDGYLDFHSIAVTNSENGCNEPELVDESACLSDIIGELGANTNVQLFVDVDNNGIFDGTDTSIYNGTLSGIAANYDVSIPLAATATKYITMTWEVPTTVNNIIQSDSSTLGMTFELGQTAGQ